VPVVRIRALPQPSADVRAVAAAVATALAAELGESPRGTWATWETVERYVEGGEAATVQPFSTHPPIVTLFAASGRPREDLLRCVAETLARALELEPGNVWVRYEEVRPGELA
jgi:phenylpyruvate tautomerase PptA (4-oxalocrotonate tautomerase family)